MASWMHMHVCNCAIRWISELARTHNCAITAGLPIKWTLGLRWHFCCRGPISNARPVFDSSAKTTQGKVLDFVVKPQNMLIWLVATKRCFSGSFRHCIGPLTSNSESDTHYECKFNTRCFVHTILSVIWVTLICWRVLQNLWFLLKNTRIRAKTCCSVHYLRSNISNGPRLHF